MNKSLYYGSIVIFMVIATWFFKTYPGVVPVFWRTGLLFLMIGLIVAPWFIAVNNIGKKED